MTGELTLIQQVDECLLLTEPVALPSTALPSVAVSSPPLVGADVPWTVSGDATRMVTAGELTLGQVDECLLLTEPVALPSTALPSAVVSLPSRLVRTCHGHSVAMKRGRQR